MDVLLNEEEELVRQGAREFFEGECPPELARESKGRGSQAYFPKDIHREFTYLA